MLSLEELADLTRELLEVSRTAVDDPRRAEFAERKRAALGNIPGAGPGSHGPYPWGGVRLDSGPGASTAGQH